MNRILLFIIAGCLIILACMGNSCETPVNQASQNADTDVVLLTGKISVKGNEPITWLSLTSAEGKDYRLQGSDIELIKRQYQQQILTLKGKILSEGTGPIPAVFQVESIEKVD